VSSHRCRGVLKGAAGGDSLAALECAGFTINVEPVKAKCLKIVL